MTKLLPSLLMACVLATIVATVLHRTVEKAELALHLSTIKD
jgi:hypothetical protein